MALEARRETYKTLQQLLLSEPIPQSASKEDIINYIRRIILRMTSKAIAEDVTQGGDTIIKNYLTTEINNYITNNITYIQSILASFVLEQHTSDDLLTIEESGSIHTNRGATGVVTLTLPASAPAGMEFVFAVQETYEESGSQLRISPGASAIRDNCGQTAGKYKWADAIGESLRLVADSNGDWITIGKNGVWYEED